MRTDALLLHISAFTHASFIGLQERFLASLEMTIRESDVFQGKHGLNQRFPSSLRLLIPSYSSLATSHKVTFPFPPNA